MRPAKNAKYMNVYIGKDVVGMLDKYCSATGASKSGVTQCAIVDYVTRSANKLGLNLDSAVQKADCLSEKNVSVEDSGADGDVPNDTPKGGFRNAVRISSEKA